MKSKVGIADAFGRLVEVGDTVVYKGKQKYLEKGQVTKVTPLGVTVDHKINIRSERIYRADKGVELLSDGECYEGGLAHTPARYFEGNVTRATKGSAGYDIRVTDGAVVKPGETVVFHTGVKVHMGQDDVLLMFVRSSVGIKRHLMMSNGTGVIDSDYHDEIMVPLTNYGSEPQEVKSGERVVQGIFVKYLLTDTDDTEEERKGGIGSTGVV